MPDPLIRHILAFDTAMNSCSVAVLDVVTDRAVKVMKPMPRGQADHLVPLIQSTVKESGLAFSDLDLIATTIGPGAFTGLRIGLSTARSLALALDIPLCGVTTMEAVVERFFNDHRGLGGDVMVLLETKRDDFYVQVFGPDNRAKGQAEALPFDILRKRYAGQAFHLCGDALARIKADGMALPADWPLTEGYDLPDPEVIARLALAQAMRGEMRPAAPLYLRDADVSVSNKPVRTILS